MSYNNSPYHSLFLRDFFPINKVGVDYANPYGINIEFKETFSQKPNLKNVIIKITQTQFTESELIVMCVHTFKFYVHKSKTLESKHKHPNSCNLTSIRATTLQKNYLFKSDNYQDLKKYLDELKEV